MLLMSAYIFIQKHLFCTLRRNDFLFEADNKVTLRNISEQSARKVSSHGFENLYSLIVWPLSGRGFMCCALKCSRHHCGGGMNWVHLYWQWKQRCLDCWQMKVVRVNTKTFQSPLSLLKLVLIKPLGESIALTYHFCLTSTVWMLKCSVVLLDLLDKLLGKIPSQSHYCTCASNII